MVIISLVIFLFITRTMLIPCPSLCPKFQSMIRNIGMSDLWVMIKWSGIRVTVVKSKLPIAMSMEQVWKELLIISSSLGNVVWDLFFLFTAFGHNCPGVPVGNADISDNYSEPITKNGTRQHFQFCDKMWRRKQQKTLKWKCKLLNPLISFYEKFPFLSLSFQQLLPGPLLKKMQIVHLSVKRIVW